MPIPASRIAEYLSQLVQIPSVSPDQAGSQANISGESRMARALSRWFTAFGGQIYVDEVLPGRPNVYAIWPGTSQRWIALDVHTDTVGVAQMQSPPFEGRLANGRIYGRGSVDTKASLAVALALLDYQHQQPEPLKPNLLIAATVDEEVGATGARACARWLTQQDFQLDEMMVAEPTLCQAIYGHKGVSRIQYTVQGQPAHSSQPQFGKNAINAAVRVIQAFEAENEALQSQASPLGSPTLSTTLIAGGTGVNVVPDSCTFSTDRRVVYGEKAAQVNQNLIRLAQAASPLPLEATIQKEINAFYQDPQADWVQRLANWSQQPPGIAAYGTNAWAYLGLAKACVVLGPGSINQAHGIEEWVALSELEKLAQLYWQWWDLA